MLFEFLSCLIIVLPITCLSLPVAAQSLLDITTPDAISALDTSVQTNTHSLTKASTTLKSDDEDCFRPPLPGEHRPIALQRDCIVAANQISRLGRWGQSLNFSRRAGSDVRLPVDIRRRTCYIYMTMFTPNDQDLIKLETIYEAALGLGVRCCSGNGQDEYGGRAFVGPLGLLYMIVAGRSPLNGESALEISDGTQTQRNISNLSNTPIVESTPAADASSIDSGQVAEAAGHIAALVAREGPVSTNSSSSILSLTDTAVSAATDTLSADTSITPNFVPNNPSTIPSANPDLTPNISSLPSNDTNTFPPTNQTGTPICAPPPYPGQRQHPLNFADCNAAIHALIGSRDIRSSYTFSHSPGPARSNYQLPQKFRYGTCTVYLDMAHADDVDTVKLGDVANTARFLAYTCSGSGIAWERYGGHVTVGLSGRDLVVVWIYGRASPRSVGGVGGGEADPSIDTFQ